MDGFPDGRTREHGRSPRPTFREARAYASDDSSSDESATSVIPNGRPMGSFRAFNPSIKKEHISPTGPRRSTGHGESPDGELEIVRSDIPPPGPQQTNPEAGRPKIAAAVPPNSAAATPPYGARDNNADGKRTMSAAARERQSQIMKGVNVFQDQRISSANSKTERWASGRMDGVHDKIKQTMKRKASLQRPAGEDNSEDDSDNRPSKRAASTVARSTLRSRRPTTLSDASISGYSPAQQELWRYIQPFLDEFRNRPIPGAYRVPQLLALPRVRELEFNPRRHGGKCRYADKEERSVAALLVYLTGILASQPCSSCVKGRGVFKRCIKISPNASWGVNIENCANCWYSHQACSYETGPEESPEDHPTKAQDRDHIVMSVGLGQDAADSEVEEVEEVEEGEEVAEVEEISEVSRTAPEEVEGPLVRPQSIINAPSGRPYCKWPGKSLLSASSKDRRTDFFQDPSGELVTLKSNVLLPDDYEVDTDSERPYCCPVDSCTRQPYISLQSLGYHFPVSQTAGEDLVDQALLSNTFA